MKQIFTLKLMKIAAISAVIFILLDLIWIGVVASQMYTEHLGFLANVKNGNIQFILPVGLFVQAIISLGLSVLIYTALLLDNRMIFSCLIGAFTGFVIYFTYDFTNYSFVKDWPLHVSIIDVCWGTFQGLLAGIYVHALNKRLH